jgi:hypothetical protein
MHMLRLYLITLRTFCGGTAYIPLVLFSERYGRMFLDLLAMTLVSRCQAWVCVKAVRSEDIYIANSMSRFIQCDFSSSSLNSVVGSGSGQVLASDGFHTITETVEENPIIGHEFILDITRRSGIKSINQPLTRTNLPLRN